MSLTASIDAAPAADGGVAFGNPDASTRAAGGTDGTIGTDGAGDPTLTFAPTFTAIFEEILTRNCVLVSCHGGGTDKFVVDRGDRSQTHANCGRQMPIGVPLLQAQIERIRGWIDRGAADD